MRTNADLDLRYRIVSPGDYVRATVLMQAFYVSKNENDTLRLHHWLSWRLNAGDVVLCVASINQFIMCLHTNGLGWFHRYDFYSMDHV